MSTGGANQDNHSTTPTTLTPITSGDKPPAQEQSPLGSTDQGVCPQEDSTNQSVCLNPWYDPVESWIAQPTTWASSWNDITLEFSDRFEKLNFKDKLETAKGYVPEQADPASFLVGVAASALLVWGYKKCCGSHQRNRHPVATSLSPESRLKGKNKK